MPKYMHSLLITTSTQSNLVCISVCVWTINAAKIPGPLENIKIVSSNKEKGQSSACVWPVLSIS